MRIGILGYGNLGRGVECAIKQNPDCELKAVFTRRNPESIKVLTKGTGVFSVDKILSYKDEIDVLIIDEPVNDPAFLSLLAQKHVELIIANKELELASKN